MYTSNEVNRVIQTIEQPELKKAITHAARILSHSTVEEERRSARQTFISLSLFGSGLAGPSLEVQERQKDPLSERAGQGLRDLLYNSGVYYFGALFQDDEDSFSPIRDRDHMLSEFAGAGYEISSLKYLKTEQLDILFTKLLETGLLSAAGIKKTSVL